MPELPEVETIRRQLMPFVLHQTIIDARASHLRAVRAHPSTGDFVAGVMGREILDILRRGKALLILLNDDTSILVRLGMSGQLILADPADPLAPHTHVVLKLSGGKEIRYIDPRTFGQMAVLAGHDPAKMPELSHYGPEPLGDEFTVDALRRIMRVKATIQAVLIDQSKVVGIGKIYADEACFAAGIHPERRAETLTEEEIIRLHTAIREVLARAVEARGTSGKDAAYRDAHGDIGNFQQQLNVYQRADQPCRVCGTPIEYRPFQGRRIHFCPRCQR